MRWRALAFVLVTASSAWAETSAEQFFREGRAAVAAKDYANACPKFAESQRLEPAPGTLLNLADCEEHLGQIVKAREHYSLAASGFARTDARREFSYKRAAMLELKLARLTLKLASSAPSGTQVQLGNAILDSSSLGVPVPTDPGEAHVVVTAPGRVDRSYSIKLADGESADLAIDAGEPEKANTIVRTVEAKQKTNVRRIAGLSILAVGVAGVTVGAITGILAIDKANIVKAHCDAQVVCDETGYAAAGDGKVFSPLSTVAIIAGASLMAVGTFFVVWSTRTKSTTAFQLSPFGASIRGEF